MIQWDDYWKTYSVSKAEKWMILERNKILNKYLDLIDKPEKKVIEIGCGFGSNIHLIKESRNDVECHWTTVRFPLILSGEKLTKHF